jgi:CMP-N,N'-diacetyllegionaminic acid synthase
LRGKLSFEPSTFNLQPSTLAVIPARGGSKGVPGKNIKPLAGVPLLAYSIRVAQQSGCCDRCIVSTDDEAIAEVARAYGAEVRMRPEEYARDDSPTLPVIEDVIRHCCPDGMPDLVVILQPTSPLRRPEHIAAAVASLQDGDDSCVSVCEAEHTPYKMYRIDDGLLTPLMKDHGIGVPRQLLPPVYRENGAIYVTRTRVLMERGTIWGDRVRPFIMDRESSLDIDTPLDFEIAEFLIQNKDFQT